MFKSIFLSLLLMSLAFSSFAAPSKSHQIDVSEEVEMMNIILQLKDQINAQKNRRIVNGIVTVGSVTLLAYGGAKLKKYWTGDSFTGFYRLGAYSIIGTGTAIGGYNVYKIKVRTDEIKELEAELDSYKKELEDIINRAELLNSIEADL